MIEITLTEYLNGRVLYDNTALPVYSEEPEKPPKRYIRIENQGTSEIDNFLYSSLVAFQVYGNTLLECVLIAETLKEALDAMESEGEIVSSGLNTKYPFNDQATHRYRYQVVYDIYHY